MEPETKARAARGDQSPKAAMDQRARETAGVLKEVDGGSEEASAPPLLAHPFSLLHLLLRACVRCLGLHGYCSDDDGPKPAADTDDDLKPVADDDNEDLKPPVAETPEEGEGDGGDDEAASEVGARVRKPPTPGPPKGGPGDDGGKHN